MHTPTVFKTLSCFLFVAIAACSGNTVVEPGAQSSKRAKLAIEKCEPEPVPGLELKEVYACVTIEDACPEPGDALTKEELGHVLNKSDETCTEGAAIYDVPCGPDLNAPVDCCYVARMRELDGTCE